MLNNFGIPGIIITILFLIALVFLFKKFLRKK